MQFYEFNKYNSVFEIYFDMITSYKTTRNLQSYCHVSPDPSMQARARQQRQRGKIVRKPTLHATNFLTQETKIKSFLLTTNVFQEYPALSHANSTNGKSLEAQLLKFPHLLFSMLLELRASHPQRNSRAHNPTAAWLPLRDPVECVRRV